MKSNPRVIKNETANFLSHTGHSRFTTEAEQGQHVHPTGLHQDKSQNKWGTITNSSRSKSVAVPQRVTPVMPETFRRVFWCPTLQC